MGVLYMAADQNGNLHLQWQEYSGNGRSSFLALVLEHHLFWVSLCCRFCCLVNVERFYPSQAIFSMYERPLYASNVKGSVPLIHVGL